ncbi:hypothetical protein FLX56_14320 [Synechococcus moorigangaii CMS01]|nr:hypothetical protein [Synechococcus moorigangaii CMS01]
MAFSNAEFEQAIAQVEDELTALKDRYEQIQTAQARLAALKDEQAALAGEPEIVQKHASLKTELNLIAEEIAKLEVQLESHLLKWQEPFWQIVRFTGVGILLGWLLKSLAT